MSGFKWSPDGKRMCCICFDYFELEDLYVDKDGVIWDLCKVDGYVEFA